MWRLHPLLFGTSRRQGTTMASSTNTNFILKSRLVAEPSAVKLCPALMAIIAEAWATKNDFVIRLPQVRQRTCRARATIYKDISLQVFPGPLSLGPRSVGWKNSEISAWLKAREFASRTKEPIDIKEFISVLMAGRAPLISTSSEHVEDE
jgi:prophage regulatory protein